MGSRFVSPEEVTLPISDGDTLTVKKWLTEGEQRQAYARMYRQGGGIDAAEVRLSKVVAYLLDWTLTNGDGSKVLIRSKSADDVRAHLDALHPEDFTEIYDAITAHEKTQAEARQEKKRPNGAIASEQTLPSVV